MRRQRRATRRSGASSKRLAALEAILDEALDTATEIRRKGVGRAAAVPLAACLPKECGANFRHPSLCSLVKEQRGKDSKWARTAFAYGPVWFNRLETRSQEDVNEMRGMFHARLDDYLGHSHPADEMLKVERAFRGASHKWSLLEEWWSQFSEFGAPSDE